MVIKLQLMASRILSLLAFTVAVAVLLLSPFHDALSGVPWLWAPAFVCVTSIILCHGELGVMTEPMGPSITKRFPQIYATHSHFQQFPIVPSINSQRAASWSDSNWHLRSSSPLNRFLFTFPQGQPRLRAASCHFPPQGNAIPANGSSLCNAAIPELMSDEKMPCIYPSRRMVRSHANARLSSYAALDVKLSKATG